MTIHEQLARFAGRRDDLSERDILEMILDGIHQLLKGQRKMDGDFSKLDADIQDITTKFDGVESALATATAANASGNQTAVQASIDEATAHLGALRGHVDSVTTVAQTAPPTPPAASTGLHFYRLPVQRTPELCHR